MSLVTYSNMNFREAIQSDLDYLADHSVSRGIQSKQPSAIEYLYTLEHEGVPLGVGGFRLINLTTAWCWVNLSDKMKHGHVIPTYRVIKEWIEMFTKEHGIKRLQAYVEVDFPEAIRMVEHLGFEQESIMKNFVGDKDAAMFVRII